MFNSNENCYGMTSLHMGIIAALPQVIKAKPSEKSSILLDYTEQFKVYLPWYVAIPVLKLPSFCFPNSTTGIHCWSLL
jgi:hypothetical protein